MLEIGLLSWGLGGDSDIEVPCCGNMEGTDNEMPYYGNTEGTLTMK